jgi:predicted anti-sigma-YlaC factor YlaD
MTRYLRPKGCDRARSWLSLELDGELSLFERRLLGAHLRRCGECAAYGETVSAATALLRGQPLERLERPVELPRAGPRLGVVRLAASAAAAAFVAVVVTGMFAVTGSKQQPRFLQQVQLTPYNVVQDLKRMRRADARLRGAAPPASHIQLPHGE